MSNQPARPAQPAQRLVDLCPECKGGAVSFRPDIWVQCANCGTLWWPKSGETIKPMFEPDPDERARSHDNP